MANKLQKYFPMIRSREEVLGDIRSREELLTLFQSWTEEQQNEFLDFCTGVRGIKILYDGFFKTIMDPDAMPERLEEFISQVLGQKVKILTVLPAEARIAEETTLSILDIVVRLEDGSIVNVEVQKIGYMFPGQRCACYSADLLLRQYKRAKSQRGKKFSYKDIKSVYTIVLFEKSPEEFKKFPEKYLHKVETKSDTGIEIDLLQKYVFLPLDIFKERRQNKSIRNKLEAWLTFFSTDDPEDIEHLIKVYPEFIPMYQEIYTICRSMENVMGLFSEELKILDKNTTMYMIDELQDRIDEQKAILNQREEEISRHKEELNKRDAAIEEMRSEIERLKALLAEK